MIYPILLLVIYNLLVLMYFPALASDTYVWNFGLSIMLLRISFASFKITKSFLYLLRYLLYGIFDSLERTYRLTAFRISVICFYIIFFIGILMYLRYLNMGRDVDLELFYQFIYKHYKLLLKVSDGIIFFWFNLIVIIISIFVIGIRIIVFWKVFYEYSGLCFESLHYWLYQYRWYWAKISTINGKLCKIQGKIGLKLRKLLPENKFCKWFAWGGVWQCFKILPFFVSLIVFVCDCYYNQFTLYWWFYNVLFISVYIIILKLVQFYGNQFEIWDFIVPELYGDFYSNSKS